MYYFTYDPWVGKQLYLEEFYVMDEYRGGCGAAHSGTSCGVHVSGVFAGLGIGSEILRELSAVSI